MGPVAHTCAHVVGGFGLELGALVRAAKAGDGHAACRLGDLYREGEKLPYKPKEAFRWYPRSAMAGLDPLSRTVSCLNCRGLSVQ